MAAGCCWQLAAGCWLAGCCWLLLRGCAEPRLPWAPCCRLARPERRSNPRPDALQPAPPLPPPLPLARRRAKAKRERLRQATLAPDYIPLGGAAGLAAASAADFKKAEEAVHSGSDDEQEEHVRMGFLSAGQQQAAAAEARCAAPPAPRCMRCRAGRPAAATAASREPGALTLPARPPLARRRKAYVQSLEQGDEDEFAAAQMSKAISRNRAGGKAGGPAAPGRPGAPPAAQQAGSILNMPPGGYGPLVQQRAAAAAKGLEDALRRLQLSQKQAEQNLQRTSGNLQVGACMHAAACARLGPLLKECLGAPLPAASLAAAAPSMAAPTTHSPRPPPARPRAGRAGQHRARAARAGAGVGQVRGGAGVSELRRRPAGVPAAQEPHR